MPGFPTPLKGFSGSPGYRAQCKAVEACALRCHSSFDTWSLPQPGPVPELGGFHSLFLNEGPCLGVLLHGSCSFPERHRTQVLRSPTYAEGHAFPAEFALVVTLKFRENAIGLHDSGSQDLSWSMRVSGLGRELPWVSDEFGGELLPGKRNGV